MHQELTAPTDMERESPSTVKVLALKLYWKVWFYSRIPLNNMRLLRKSLNITYGKKKALFTIKNWYGRSGNNVQQVLIAVAHAEFYRGAFKLDKQQLYGSTISDLIRPFRVDFQDAIACNYCLKSNWFHFTEYAARRGLLKRMTSKPGWSPRKECLLSQRYLEANMHRLALQYLKPHLIAAKSRNIPTDAIVIHLRSGDVQDLTYDYYMTNPLWYYEQLAGIFSSAIVVTESSPPHILLEFYHCTLPS